MKGSGFFDKLAEYEGILNILYGVGVIILIILIYIVFFRNQITIEPTSTPTNTPTNTVSTMNNTTNKTRSTPTPIPTSVVSKIKNLKNTVSKEINEAEAILIIKGKLEDWGDNINKLPDDVREKAIACYKNTDGCIF